MAVWRYLMWRCLTLSGDGKAAGAMLERLLAPLPDADYVQFRYLRKGGAR